MKPLEFYKLIIIGDTEVGKTTIITSYTTGATPETTRSTIGAALTNKSVELDDGTIIKLQIWDTAGQEKFKGLIPLYLRNAHGAIIVADVTAIDESYIPALNEYVNEVISGASESVQIIILLNKVDLDYDKAKIEPIMRWSEEEGYPVFLVSAVKHTGLEDAFVYICAQMLENCSSEMGIASSKIINDSYGKTKKKDNKQCC
jgi:Ras-related protein Rab-1A